MDKWYEGEQLLLIIGDFMEHVRIVQCENIADPECLCDACRDYFENGLGLFSYDQELQSETEEDNLTNLLLKGEK